MIDQTRKNATILSFKTNLSLEGFVGGGCEKNTVEWFIFVPPLCLTVQLPRRMAEEVKKEKYPFGSKKKEQEINEGNKKRKKKIFEQEIKYNIPGNCQTIPPLIQR